MSLSIFFYIIVLVTLQHLFVQCLIQDLRVRKTDAQLIAKKRQDTLEICRIFKSETERLNNINPFNKYKQHSNVAKVRSKRSAVFEPVKFIGNPVLGKDDARRVETIVDRLYDDLEEDGKRVTYRQKNLHSTTTVKDGLLSNNTERRFNFAPALLLGPGSEDLPSEKKHVADTGGAGGIPWQKRWTHGIVPYFIDPSSYDTHLSDVIMEAFDYFEKATCIRLQRLRERPTDRKSLQNVEWVYVTNPSGVRQCVHSNERKPNKGVQIVIFGYACMSVGEIVHEVMHILGFGHEHMRPDRDQYITILWDNIKPGYKKYFEHRKEFQQTKDYSSVLMSLPYDYNSVLHYPTRAFSKNGQQTILAEAGIKIGQREALSETDVEKVGMIFGNECMNRNKQYLLTTCPSVIKVDMHTEPVPQTDIKDYFRHRLWPYGIVNYKIRDKMEFSAEERENIGAVIRHIEKETCIEFRDLSIAEPGDENDGKINDAKTTTNVNTESKEDDGKSTELSTVDLNAQPVFEPDTQNAENQNKQIQSDGQNDAFTPQKDHVELIEENTSIIAANKDSRDGNAFENLNLLASDDNAVENNEVSDSENRLNKIEEGLSEKNSQDNVMIPSDSAILRKKPIDSKASKMPRQTSKTKNATHLLTKHRKPVAKQSPKPKRVKRAAISSSSPPSPHRRHADSILVLTRSPAPGCECPTPGKPNGNKVLEINAGCFNSVNDLLHLFMHVLGLDHQHNMHDRDSYLHIVWDKLTPEIRDEMQVKLPQAAAVGFPYDYQSVMHYPWLQIKNGVTNIMYPIWNDGWAMGHWQGLSSTDVQKISSLYFEQCAERKKYVNNQNK